MNSNSAHSVNLPVVALHGLTRVGNHNQFRISGDVISKEQPCWRARLFGAEQMPSELSPNYIPAGQFKLRVLGEDYKMDINKPRFIGTGNDDLPINRNVLSPVLNVTLNPNTLEITDSQKLVLLSADSIIVIRHKKEASDRHQAFVLHEQNVDPFRINGGINILEKCANEENAYTADEYSLPRTKFDVQDIPQKENDEGFNLESNDTILVPLGLKKGIDKSLVWLRIVYNPQSLENQRQPNSPAEHIPLNANYVPKIDRVVGAEQDVDIEQLLSEITSRKSTTYLDLVSTEFGSEIKENLIRFAKIAEARKSSDDSRDLEQLKEDMALNWLLKVAAFKFIAQQYGFEQVEQIGKDEDTAILGLSANGSILSMSRFTDVHDQENRSFREISYTRLSDRKDTNAESFSQNLGHITADIRINERARVRNITTSRLLFLAINRKADRILLHRSLGVSELVFSNINKSTRTR